MMNYKLLKNKMNKFFSKVSAEELKAELEKLGYKFVEITEEEKKKQPKHHVRNK